MLSDDSRDAERRVVRVDPLAHVIHRDPDRVGANLGTQTAFDVSGFVLGPLLAAVLAQVLGLRAPYALAGAPLLHGLYPGAVGVPPYEF